MVSGLAEFIFLMIEIENGRIPEFAVMAVFPSGLNTKPYGCGAVEICTPLGVIIRPLGMIVWPVLSILAGVFPAGASITTCA